MAYIYCGRHGASLGAKMILVITHSYATKLYEALEMFVVWAVICLFFCGGWLLLFALGLLERMCTSIRVRLKRYWSGRG